MGNETTICSNAFSVRPIVMEHMRRDPQLKTEFQNFCREGEYQGTCVFNGEAKNGSIKDAFCRLQTKVEALAYRLERLRQERVRWAEKAESFWQQIGERLGDIDSVVGNKKGKLNVSIDIPWESVRVMVSLAVGDKSNEDGGGLLIDGGFRVWFDSPNEARRWLRTNLDRLPQVFSACEPRLGFVPLADNDSFLIDRLYPCWETRARNKGISDPWVAWQAMFHPRELLVF